MNIKITVTYADGSEKTVDRGACSSVYEEGDSVKVNVDGVGSNEDAATVLAIVAKIARDNGIDDEIINAVYEV